MIVTAELQEKIKITSWPKATHSIGGKEREFTWPDYLEYLEKAAAQIKQKADLPAPVFATFRPECTPEDCSKAREQKKTLKRHRCDDAVTGVTALVFDHDHYAGDEPKSFSTVRKWCEKHGLAYVLYESPRSNLEGDDGAVGPRFRVVIPLSEPADPKTWKQTYEVLRAYFEREMGISFDSKCCNPSRIFYPPARPTEEVPARFTIFKFGGSLDLKATVANILASLPAPTHELPSIRPPRPTSTIPPPSVNASDIFELDSKDRDAFERWGQGAFRSAVRTVERAAEGDRNETLNKQAFGLYSRFGCNGLLDEGAITSALLGAARAAGLPEKEATKTLESALTGARAKPVLRHDVVADWQRTRRAPQARRAAPPASPAPESAPAPEHDPETGEVFEPPAPSPAPIAPEPPGPPPTPDSIPDPEPEFPEPPPGLDRLKDVLGDVIKNERLVCPRGFTVMDDNGLRVAKLVEKKNKNGGTYTVSVNLTMNPIWVESTMSNPGSEGDLIDVRAVTRRGNEQSRVLPKGLLQDAKKLAIALESGGISLEVDSNTQHDVSQYIAKFIDTNYLWLPHKRAQRRTGWDAEKRSFLLGSECVGDENTVLYTGGQADSMVSAFSCKGSPDVWRKTAEEFIEASPTAGLALAAAAASPCLRAFGWAPVGIIMGGLGGTGKTAILALAGSAFGSTGDFSSRQASGVIGNGIATSNALVGQFQMLADLPHLADEVRFEMRARNELEAALHSLIDGQGRSRLRRDSLGVIATESAPGCAILGTETDPSEFLRKGGAIRRYLCPRPPYGEQLGRFREELSAHFGHAGTSLVHTLVNAVPTRRAELSRIRVDMQKMVPAEITSETARTWAEQISVCLATVRIANMLNPGLWPNEELWTRSIMASWELLCPENSEETASESNPVVAAYTKTVEWVLSHRAHFSPTEDRLRYLGNNIGDGAIERRRQSIREPIYGKVKQVTREDMEDECLQVVDVHQSRLVEFLGENGYSMRTMCAEWVRKGWLLGGKDGRTSAKICGIKTHVYRLVLPSSQLEDVAVPTRKWEGAPPQN